MGNILKLPCTRFVRQVSNGVAMSKYGYIGMMQKNAEAIKSTPWRKAVCNADDVALTVNKVTESDGVWSSDTGMWEKKPTFSAFLKDNYDCFKQGGDAVKETGTFCGYLGMVAYRFMLPTVNPGAIEELRLMIQRDRYLRSGVRVAIEINSNAAPSDDWATIRGEKTGMYVTPSTSSTVLGVSSWGFMGQNDVPWLLASRAIDATLTVSADDFAGLADAAAGKYLWLYMSIEDPVDYWELYSSTEERYYSIEGSAALVASCCEFAFTTDAVAPESAEETAAAIDWWKSEYNLKTEDFSEWGTGGTKLTRYGKLAICSGAGAILMPNMYGNTAGSAGIIGLRGGEGSFLFESADPCFDRANGELSYDPVKKKEVILFSDYNRFFGVPSTKATGLCFHLETYLSPNDGGDLFGSKVQAVWGADWNVVPTYKAEYSRFRIVHGNLADKEKCDVSINVWRSKSRSFYSGFPRAALQSLASNPILYTGDEKTISGSVVESVWREFETDESGVVGPKGAPIEISLTVEADLIATVGLTGAYDAGGGAKAVDVTGVSVHPGEIIILAPKVERVSLDDAMQDRAYWGLADPDKLDGMKPTLEFA